MSYDVVVIGSGHNSLVAALTLAKAGRKVVVLEQHEEFGGLCAEREFHPGYKVPGLLHDTGAVTAKLVEALGLQQHGLQFRSEPAPVWVPTLGSDGSASEQAGFLLHRSAERCAAELRKHGSEDADAILKWRGFLTRVSGFVGGLMEQPPPPMDVASWGSVWQLARRGLGLRRLGKTDMTEVMRVVPMCVADWLREHFSSPALCEALAAPAVQHSFAGPWSAGTAATLLFQECAGGAEVAGGPAALVRALLAACRAAGVELRNNTRVTRIHCQGGAVSGVELADGERIDSGRVAAGCDPKQTLLQLLAPRDLPFELESEVRVLRCRGLAAKVHLALNGPLAFFGMDNVEAARIGGGSLDTLEQAFDAVKYRGFSAAPHLDVRVPSIAQTDLAPTGHHVASVLVSFAPLGLEGGWTNDARQRLLEAVLQRLQAAAADVRDRVVGHEVLTPAELEQEFQLTGGHMHHAEPALDQLLFMRPTPSCAGYRTPVRGLFLCGSGSHPGGGMTGMPGRLAAQQMLA